MKYEAFYDSTKNKWGILGRDDNEGYWFVQQEAVLDRRNAEALARGLTHESAWN